MKKLVLILLIMPFILKAQEPPKGANTIIVKNNEITFKQILGLLLDAGYSIEKSDTSLQTARTEFKNCPLKNGKPSTTNIQINVRIRDSLIWITAKWYSNIGLSRGFLEPSRQPGPTDINEVNYSFLGLKIAFAEMNKFALSLKGELSYSKK